MLIGVKRTGLNGLHWRKVYPANGYNQKGEQRMFVKYVTEKPDGSVVFQGHLEGAELKLVLEVGIQTMLERGISMPFLVNDEEEGEPFDFARVMPNPGTEQ